MEEQADPTEGEGYCVEHEVRSLTAEEKITLHHQDSRGFVGDFQQQKLEKEAAKNWDKFYKRNETRFFKDRHWTTREFQELIGSGESKRTLLEVGCGVGNFLYPLLEDELNLFIYACDFSPRAVQLVKNHPRYDESKIGAFECDVTKDDLRSKMDGAVNIISMIFVLSAVHPDNFKVVVSNLYRCLKPGGVVLLRDYGLNDMAMIRFAPGSKLGEQFYVRQDATRLLMTETLGRCVERSVSYSHCCRISASRIKLGKCTAQWCKDLRFDGSYLL